MSLNEPPTDYSTRLPAFRLWCRDQNISIHPKLAIASGLATDGTKGAPKISFQTQTQVTAIQSANEAPASVALNLPCGVRTTTALNPDTELFRVRRSCCIDRALCERSWVGEAMREGVMKKLGGGKDNKSGAEQEWVGRGAQLQKEKERLSGR